ncbi:hypothetical protein BGZ60DRAFT_549282 [Tricladium varicosporioides]|nr:hypothetical protein BGZ60DRAFT_549282 [Hymenoscyphus varicosporioides]
MIWLWLLPLFLIDYEWWFLYLAAFFIFRSCSIETEEPREEEESETWRAQRDAFIQKREVEREWDRALEDLLICERQSLKSQRLKSIQPPGIRSLVRNNTTTFEYPVADRQSYYFESPIGQQHRRAHNTSNHATNYNAFSTPTYSTSILHQASSSSSSSEYQGMVRGGTRSMFVDANCVRNATAPAGSFSNAHGVESKPVVVAKQI